MIDARLLSLLLACKRRIETDAYSIDGEWGECRTIEQLIDQDAMPDEWKSLVNYLREIENLGYRNGVADAKRKRVKRQRKPLKKN